MTKDWKASGLMAVTLAVVLALLFTACAPAAKPVVEEKKIKVGLSTFVTGPVASTGQGWHEGYIYYLRYVNDELGGVEYANAEGKTEKVKLDILWEDSGYSVPRGISIYKRQKAAGVMLRILSSSSETEALAETISRDHMPTFTMSASPMIMAPKPRYCTAGYLSYSDLLGGMVKWIVGEWKEARPPRIGFIMPDATATRVAGRYVTPEKIAALGAEYVSLEWLPLMFTDSTIELTRIRAASPDYVLIIHVPAGNLVIFKDAIRLGMLEEVTWCLQGIATDELTLRLLGDMVEGVYFQTPCSWPTDDLPGVKLAHSIIGKYRGRDATVLNVNTTYYSMAAVEALRLALEKVGYENLTREAINEAILGLKDFDTGGICPPITVDPSYPVLNTHIKMGVARGGKFMPLSGWLECPELATRPE